MATAPDRERATLLDRFALGALSGFSALLLGGLLWGGLSITAAQLGFDSLPSPIWVGAFAGLMALLGFVLLENFVAVAVARMLHWVLRLLRILTP